MARVGRRRARRGEEQWGEILRRFATSGQGARAFCRREGVPLSSLQRWRQRLGSQGEARFVELVATPPASAQPAAWALEISLPNGASLRLRG